MKLVSKSARGFTIVELLIAAAITLGIVVVLGTMFGSLSKTSSRANQRIDAFRDARAALQMIERDLTGVVSSAKTSAYFVINSDGSNVDGSRARHIYALISTQNHATPASATGDMCAVGYYCNWVSDPNNPSTGSYQLLRYFRDSFTTYNNLKNAAGYAGITNLYQLSANDELLAANCWNLMVTAYDASGNILTPDQANQPTTTAPYVCNQSATATTPLPAVIEISFKAMSQNAARTAIASGAGPKVWMAYDEPGANSQDKQKYERLIAPNVYEFRTRINL